MAYRFINFPIRPRPPGEFIPPIGRTSRLSKTPQLGVIARGPYDIVDVGALLASQAELNRTATPLADKHLTVAAFDSPIPVPYGHIKVPALLANAVTWNNYWYFWCLWGRGPIDAIESLYINDAAPAFGYSESRLGTLTQSVIGGLYLPLSVWYQSIHGAIPGSSFDQSAPGIAHSVIVAPVDDIQQPPTLNAILRGLKIYDPRDVTQDVATPSTWLYSNNAALVLADFLRSSVYGAGLTVDDASLVIAADAADDLTRTVNLLVDKKVQLSDWVATLQQAANCRLDLGASSVKLIPDADTTSVATFTHDDGDILAVTKEQMESQRNLPTVIEVIYTDASETTWKDASVTVQRPGVDTGTVPWRKSTVRMPWIVDFGGVTVGVGKAQALRECYLRMNQAWLRIPKMALSVMDEGLIPAVGDPIDVTYPESGYLAKFKVDNSQATDAGWALSVFYDDPGAYADDHIAVPTPPTPNTDPFGLFPVRNLAAREDAVNPKLIVTWLPPRSNSPLSPTVVLYPYVLDYPFTVDETVSMSRVYDSLAPNRPALARPDPSFTTPNLTPGLDYTITVWVRNVFGILGPPTSIIAHVNAIDYVAGHYCFTLVTLVNMRAMLNWSTGARFWVTDMGDLWDTTFASTFDTYTNPLYSYHSSGTSLLTTESSDLGEVLTGDWTGSTDTTAISGTATNYIELKIGNLPIVRYPGAAVTASGQYVRFSSETLTTSTQRVDGLGCYTITVGRITPITSGALLKEDGDKILLEDGSSLLLE